MGFAVIIRHLLHATALTDPAHPYSHSETNPFTPLIHRWEMGVQRELKVAQSLTAGETWCQDGTQARLTQTSPGPSANRAAVTQVCRKRGRRVG